MRLGVHVTHSSRVPRAESLLPLPQLSLRRLNRDPLGVLERLRERQGGAAVAFIGRQRVVYVSDPDLVEGVFVTNADSVGKWGRTERRWRAGGPRRHGSTWLSSHRKAAYLPARRALLTRYARARTAADVPAFAKLTEQFLAEADGEPTDLFAFCEDLLVATTTYHLLGLRLTPERAREIARLYRRTVLGVPGTFTSPIRERGLTQVGARRTRCSQRAAQAQFAQTLRGLVASADASDPSSIPGLIAAGVIGEEALGGIPGPVAPLAHLLLALGEAGDTAAALRADAARVLAREPDLPAHYEAAVRESVRLGATWRVNRIVLEPFAADSISYRPGDVVVSSPHLLHRDPRFWAAPDAFSLANWEEEAARARPARAFIPFGFPSRSCVGKNIVYTQLAAIGATIAAGWGVELLGKPPEWFPRQDSEVVAREPIVGRIVRRSLSGIAAARASAPTAVHGSA